MGVQFAGSVRPTIKRRLLVVLLGAVCVPSFAISQAQAGASDVARDVVNSVIQTTIQNIRDRLQRRQPAFVAPLRFNGEDFNASSIFDEAFGALGYAGMPKKAPAMTPAAAQWLYGVSGTGSYDASRASAAGITTTTDSYTVTGEGDITKIGIFEASDALTFIVTGSHNWSSSMGIDSTTPGIAGTVAYTNGNFSADFTVNDQWTRSMGMTTTTVSYSPNVQYKFDLPNAWFIEPTIGVTWSESYVPAPAPDTNSTELHGGARIGTEWMSGGVRLQPSISGTVFTITHDSLPPVVAAAGASASQQGKVGGRGAGKLNIVWNENFSDFIEVHGSEIAGTSDIGVTGGLRLNW